MRSFLGAFALALSAPLAAQPAQTDLTFASPLAGAWRYTPVAGGSEASFLTPAGASQVTVRCTRATRRVAILKPSSPGASSLWVWTSLQSRTVPATFDPATGLTSAELSAFDGLLDAMASSAGRLGFSTPGAAPLVVPAWPDVARVIEDCRA